MPIMDGYLEKIFGRLYDTLTIPYGVFNGKLMMFCSPVGTWINGRQKTFADTNMAMHRCIPAPMRFNAKRIRMEIVNPLGVDPDGDLQRFKEHCTLSLSISHKNYFTAPVSTVLLEDWIRTAVAKIGNNQAEQIGPYLDEALAKGLLGVGGLEEESCLIESQQEFHVDICADEPFSLAHDLTFRVFLEGPLYRAVC